MNKDLRKVVILLAHPNMKESQANKALIDAVSDIEGVAVFNLYDQQGASFDVDEWSKIISDASALIYQFPFHWMAAPSLLKKWQDEVFTFLSKTPAVAGKPLTVVTTTGSEYESYRSGFCLRYGMLHIRNLWWLLLSMVSRLLPESWKGR